MPAESSRLAVQNRRFAQATPMTHGPLTAYNLRCALGSRDNDAIVKALNAFLSANMTREQALRVAVTVGTMCGKGHEAASIMEVIDCELAH